MKLARFALFAFVARCSGETLPPPPPPATNPPASAPVLPPPSSPPATPPSAKLALKPSQPVIVELHVQTRAHQPFKGRFEVQDASGAVIARHQGQKKHERGVESLILSSGTYTVVVPDQKFKKSIEVSGGGKRQKQVVRVVLP